MEKSEREAPPEKTQHLAYQRDEHHVHLIVSHLIWGSTERRPVLRGAITERCCTLLEQKCQEQGWTILELAIRPDHLHLFGRVMSALQARSLVMCSCFFLLEAERLFQQEDLPQTHPAKRTVT